MTVDYEKMEASLRIESGEACGLGETSEAGATARSKCDTGTYADSLASPECKTW